MNIFAVIKYITNTQFVYHSHRGNVVKVKICGSAIAVVTDVIDLTDRRDFTVIKDTANSRASLIAQENAAVLSIN